jgi:hypothetical protein
MMIVMTNSGGLASTWLYRKNQAPNYKTGYMTIMALLAIATLAAVYLRYHFLRINKARDVLCDAAREPERADEATVPGQAIKADKGDRSIHFSYTI